ncbi:MAG TPA: HAMP domain-containing sensor histidine kinase [Gemmataceae bacterium]|jgi:signal transduction histidine kinase
MKSIRASLIVYFWLLLGLGLGAASLLAYRIAADSLRTKQEVNRELLETRFRDREQQEKARFDDHLLAKARVVAFQVRAEFPRDRLDLVRYLMPLANMHGSQADLTSIWTTPSPGRSPWLASSLTSGTVRRLLTEIKLDESELPHEPDDTVAEFFQIDSDSGVHWPPGGEPYFKTGTFDPAKSADWVWDDVTLPNGKPGRRVQFKSSSTRVRFSFSRRGRGPDRPPGERLPPPGGDRPPSGGDRGPPAAPWIVVHCASETTHRDEAIAAHRDKRNSDLGALEEDDRDTLAGLRRLLLVIALVTFMVTTVGGYLLVGVGLAPLRRVTEAVSRVSPRNFRLPLPDDEPLPKELTPIRDRLQGTLDELRKAFEREKQAAADISHELRTPVASMLTTVEVALRKHRSAEEYRQTLEDCRGLARQMRQLVERIMALARLDAGSDRLRPRPVDVGELVQECAALVKPLAGERGLELRVHCPKPVVWTTDPDKLREVLVNLLHNAVEYNKPAGAIDVSAQAADGWLDVQVHDTGVGIAAEAFEHIFERFYRADPSRHASELHAGLGLSIVKGYVGLLGGTITVDSRVGQGSTFRVRLPSAAAAA